MTLETILRAAVSSMINGKRSAHCYSAHVPGRGYVNDGNAKLHDRADYLRQLQREAQSEVDNMGYARDYATPGYDRPSKGILFADWNKFPEDFDRVLERAGYAVEWSDEWTTCEDCNNAVRTSPDSYCFREYGQFIEGTRDYNDPYQSDTVYLCLDCLQDWALGCRATELDAIQDALQEAIADNLSDLEDRLYAHLDAREE